MGKIINKVVMKKIINSVDFNIVKCEEKLSALKYLKSKYSDAMICEYPSFYLNKKALMFETKNDADYNKVIISDNRIINFLDGYDVDIHKDSKMPESLEKLLILR